MSEEVHFDTEEIYFELLSTYQNHSTDKLHREIVKVGNSSPETREFLSDQLVKRLGTYIIPTLSGLLDDSKRESSVKDQDTLRTLKYLNLVVTIGMGNDDYVALTPMGRLVLMKMKPKLLIPMGRNSKLLHMLGAINLKSFNDYMEDLNGTHILSLDYQPEHNRVKYRRISRDASVKSSYLELDPSKPLDINTVEVFKTIERFLRTR